MAEIQLINNNRIMVIDFLRGFAMLGVVVSNFMAFQNPKIKSFGFSHLLRLLEEFAFGPAWIALSFLFGFGFWSLIQHSKSGYWTFLQRMFWLFLIGMLNACIFHIDILRDFAAVGILLLFTKYLSREKLLLLTILCTISMPFLRAYTTGLGFSNMSEFNQIDSLLMSDDWKDVIYYNLKFIEIAQVKYPVYLVSVHFEIFCFFLWGILSNRYSVFEKIKSIYNYSKYLIFISLTGIILTHILMRFDSSFYIVIDQYFNLKIWKETLYACFVFALITQIYLSGIVKFLIELITLYGRLTLTNYLVQSIISLFLFSGIGLGLGKNQPLWIYFSIAILVYFSQIIFSFYWLNRFRIGPVEWIWRSLSARRFYPLKKSD